MRDDPLSIDPTWSLISTGDVLTFRFRETYHPPYRNSFRGACKGFSRSSRIRLLKKINTFDWAAIGDSLFLTVGYPDSVVHTDREKRNRERYLFHRYMETDLGRSLSMAWRVEYVPRKSGEHKGIVLPHLHLLVFSCKYISLHKLRAWWKGILHYEGPLSLHLRKVPAGNLAAFYIAKYCAKVPPPPCLDNGSYLNSDGRVHGFHRQSGIPLCPTEVCEHLSLSLVELAQVRVSRLLKYVYLDAPSTFTVFGKAAKELLAELRKKGLTFDKPAS